MSTAGERTWLFFGPTLYKLSTVKSATAWYSGDTDDCMGHTAEQPSVEQDDADFRPLGRARTSSHLAGFRTAAMRSVSPDEVHSTGRLVLRTHTPDERRRVYLDCPASSGGSHGMPIDSGTARQCEIHTPRPFTAHLDLQKL